MESKNKVSRKRLYIYHYIYNETMIDNSTEVLKMKVEDRNVIINRKKVWQK